MKLLLFIYEVVYHDSLLYPCVQIFVGIFKFWKNLLEMFYLILVNLKLFEFWENWDFIEKIRLVIKLLKHLNNLAKAINTLFFIVIATCNYCLQDHTVKLFSKLYVYFKKKVGQINLRILRTFTLFNVWLFTVLVNWKYTPSCERHVITFARPHTSHTKNIVAVCQMSKTLYVLLFRLFLIHSFFALLITLFTISLMKLSVRLYSTFHLILFFHIVTFSFFMYPHIKHT